MKAMLRAIPPLLMTALAFLLRALGGWDAALALMLGMMALDLASGLILSLLRKSSKTQGRGFDSNALFLGLTRKLLMLLLVMLGTSLDGLLGTSLCRLSVIGFYAANEAFSVIENAALAGVPFPKGLLASLERFRGQVDSVEAPDVKSA